MCDLLGMSYNLPVRPKFSFKSFRHRGESNPHGWGLAFYPDESVQIIKEPIKAGKSELSEFLKDYSKLRSKVFIAHVRLASSGNKSHKNTPPFCRELNGKEYVFAHNGTMHSNNYKSLETGRFTPVGGTDSEHVFCYLLNCIAGRGITHLTTRDFDWLAEMLGRINDYGTFNCILSDGKFLFCYYDKDGHNGLCFNPREAPYGRIRLLYEKGEINLDEEKEPEQSGYIVATTRLTDEQWKSFGFGELIVFKSGKMVYSNRRNI